MTVVHSFQAKHAVWLYLYLMTCCTAFIVNFPYFVVPSQGPNRESDFVIAITTLLALICMGYLTKVFLRQRNERIETDDEVITWYDFRGKERIRCLWKDIQKVTKESTGLEYGYIAVVQTTKGNIRFSSCISKADDLYEKFLLRATANTT